jgi:hypothetical protein
MDRLSRRMHVAQCADHYAAAYQWEKAASCTGNAFDSFETEKTVTYAAERVALSTRVWFPIASLSRWWVEKSVRKDKRRYKGKKQAKYDAWNVIIPCTVLSKIKSTHLLGIVHTEVFCQVITMVCLINFAQCWQTNSMEQIPESSEPESCWTYTETPFILRNDRFRCHVRSI